LIGSTILVLDEIGIRWGFSYGFVLTAVSGVATAGFVFFLDRGRTIIGAAGQSRQKISITGISQPASAGD